MRSTLVLVAVVALQLSPFVISQYLPYSLSLGIELIIDKFIIILIISLLYLKNSFKRNYIKFFILILIILTWLLFVNKLGKIIFHGSNSAVAMFVKISDNEWDETTGNMEL
jgi:hypothetical protein